MQGIYTYLPETNHVSRQYSVAANSVVIIHCAYNAISTVKSFVLLRDHHHYQYIIIIRMV
jgi:hypothetical protein